MPPIQASYCHPASAADLPAPRFWLGVDGGGTHTRLRLTDANGRVLGEGQSGPSALGQGVEQAWAAIGQALANATQQARLPQVPAWSVCAAGLGLSGAGAATLAARFLAAAPAGFRCALDTDGHAGVLGAHAGQPGGLVIAGTGSVAEALWADGRRHTVGGWGWVNGDEGSGAWLGKAALRHTQRTLDGREAAGALAHAVRSAVGPSAQALLDWSLHAGQSGFATLAPLVFSAADEDPVANAWLCRAVDELNLLAQAVDPSAQLPLVMAGSIAQRLAPRLAPAVRARCVTAQGDAMAGALLMARSTLLPAPQKATALPPFSDGVPQ